MSARPPADVPADWVTWAQAQFGLTRSGAEAAAAAAHQAWARGGSNEEVVAAARRAADRPAQIEGPVAYGGDVRQSGEYVAGHDLTVDQSRHVDRSQYHLEVDQLAPIRNATGIPKAIMVVGVLVTLVGFGICVSAMYEFFTALTSGGISNDPSAPQPPPVVAEAFQRFITGFVVGFAGSVLIVVGGIFRPRNRSR